MYERFSDRARKVLQLANQEAQKLNHEYIGTEHILLGLCREGTGIGANVLKNLGIGLADICLAVNSKLVPGPDMVIMGKLPQTPRAKKVIEGAIEEARTLGHNYIGSEHLLMGLLREQEGIAGQVLRGMGVTLENVRKETLNLMGQSKPTSPRLDMDWQVVVSRTERMLTDWPLVRAGTAESCPITDQEVLKQLLENQYVILNLLRPQEEHSWKGTIQVTTKEKNA